MSNNDHTNATLLKARGKKYHHRQERTSISFVRTNYVFMIQQLKQSLENLSYNTFNFNFYIQKYITKEEFSKKKKKFVVSKSCVVRDALKYSFRSLTSFLDSKIICQLQILVLLHVFKWSNR